MDGFTVIDAVVAGVIVLSALLAYARGLVREVMAIGGWIVAGMLAFVFAPQVEPLIKEVPVVGGLLADSCELAIVVAFGAVFALCLVVVSLFTPLLSSLVQDSALGPFDQGLGFLFGVARGVVLCAIAFFLFSVAMPGQSVPMVEDSRSAEIFLQLTRTVEDQNPERALGWITGQYEALVQACDASYGRDA
ncbi:MAG: CvpA family protein [Paracoccaceae bacterium]